MRIKDLLKHPLFSGSFLMIGGSMAINVVNYVYHVVMGRILGPVDYGVLASIFSLLYIISIAPLSTSVAIVKFISSAKNTKEVSVIYYGIKNFIFKVAIGSSIVVLILSFPVAKFLHIQNIWSVVFVVPILFFSLVTLVNQASLQGVLEFIGVVGPNLVSGIVKLLLGLVFVFMGWSVAGAVGAVAIGAIVAYLYSALLFKKIIKKGKPGEFKLGPFLKYAFPVLLQALAFTSFFTVDVLLVKHFLPAFDAGLYAALSTLGKIIYFAATPIAGVMFPIVAGRHSKGESYKKVLLASLAATVVISLLIVGVYGLFPQIAIGVLFGSKYLSAQKELVWMGVFMTFYTVSYFLTNYLLSIGKTRVVIFPIIAAIAQAVLIFFFFHNGLQEVINASLYCMIALFFCLLMYMIIENEKK